MDGARFDVIDCDGHLLESTDELAEFTEPHMRRALLEPGRGILEQAFPSIDGFHGLMNPATGDRGEREYLTASAQPKGSGPDYLAFLDAVGAERGVVFPTAALAVGFIQGADYAVRICRAYNDYVHGRYAGASDRIHPMALLPCQDQPAAALELRRAVKELGFPGGMVPSTGLPLHVGHAFYLPIYQEAADLDCVIGIHGGSTLGFGMDTFSVRGVPSLHHSIPLMLAMSSLLGHGIFDRFPALRLGFFEGGCAWLTCLLERIDRNEGVTGRVGARALWDHLASGRILVGCEGTEWSLASLAKQVGIQAFAWASDYLHEVDLNAARHMLDETVKHPVLSNDEKAALLGDNARRFFRLPTPRGRDANGAPGRASPTSQRA